MRLQPRAQPDSDSPYIAASSFPSDTYSRCFEARFRLHGKMAAQFSQHRIQVCMDFHFIGRNGRSQGDSKKTLSGLASAFDADFAEAQHDLASGHRPAEIKFRAEARENENLVDLPPHFRRGWPEKNRISRHLAFSVQRRLHDQDASL